MTLGKILTLRGPNVWGGAPVVEAEFEAGDLTGPLPGPVVGRLNGLLAALGGEGSVTAELSGAEGDLAQILVDAASRLQARAGSPQVFRADRPAGGGRAARVAIGFEEADLAIASLQAARALCEAAARGLAYDVGAEVGRLRELASDVLLGPTTAEVVGAARRRGIPVRRLIPGRSLFQLGHGAKLRRIYGSATDRTGVVSQAASTDKELTKEILRGLGVPVPEGRPVVDAEDAWAAASEIGPPVVVKPRDYDYGHGITLNISSREQVVAAYAAARERSEGVLVERFISGDDHRVLVVDGRVVAVSRRRPPQVVGDGRSTISALVDRLNADPRRGVEATSHLRIIRLEETELTTLGEQGYRPDSVPPAGTTVLIRRNSHLRNGGSMTDETDRIHPRTVEHACEAAHVLGIDIAGLDIVAQDLARPLEEQGGAILEVNASPGFDLHIAPWASHPRPVGAAVIDSLFPGDETGRIPLVAVYGGPAGPSAARLIAQSLHRPGRQAGLASSEGLFLWPRRLTPRPGNRFDGARDLLANPAVKAAVIEVTRGGIEHDGLAFDRADVAVILAAGDSPDAARCLVATVPESGALVLNADDPAALTLASSSKAPVILISRRGRPESAAQGLICSRAVYVRDGLIHWAVDDHEESLGPPSKVSEGIPVESILAALATAWTLKLPLDVIRSLV